MLFSSFAGRSVIEVIATNQWRMTGRSDLRRPLLFLASVDLILIIVYDSVN